MKKFLTSILIAGLGSGLTAYAQDKEPPTIEEIFYQDIVEPIIAAQCQGCHGESFPAADVSLVAQDDIIAAKERMIVQIQEGLMPYGNPEWKDTNEAKTLLYWLSQQEQAAE